MAGGEVQTLTTTTQSEILSNDEPTPVTTHIEELLSTIEKNTKERNDIREALRFQVRCFERFESVMLSKTENKEKELRHFLVCRPLAPEPENPHSLSTSIAPIQSTVPAVRPVPTLIGGSTKSIDGLLGPALPLTSGSLGSSTTPFASNGQTVTRSDSRNLLPQADADSDDPPLYNNVPVDASVNLVLSRLRRLQNSCDSLVATNQTELQSLTFTQNSQNGKRITMRVRVLEQENEELTKANHTGRAARLQTEIALRRGFVQDLKQTYADMEYLVEEVESETEALGSTLLMLQQRLNLAKATAQILVCELESHEPGKASRIFEQANWSPFDNVPSMVSANQPGSPNNAENSPTAFGSDNNEWTMSSSYDDRGNPIQSPSDSSGMDHCSAESLRQSNKLTDEHGESVNARKRRHQDDDSPSVLRSPDHVTLSPPSSTLPPCRVKRTSKFRPSIPVTGPQRTLIGLTSAHETLERTCELLYDKSETIEKPKNGTFSPPMNNGPTSTASGV